MIISQCHCDTGPEPSTGSKRKSPQEPALQPAAKKGRLLKQGSSSVKDEPMTAASDAESADEMTSPVKKSRKRLVDSDDDDDEDFTPGVLQDAQCNKLLFCRSILTVCSISE